MSEILSKATEALRAVGKVTRNVAYPKEFELYLCAFEVTDQNFSTLQYFVFPVMPISMDEGQTFISNVKKTLGGTVVLSSQGFVPRDITITGTFGRKFKVLLGGDYVDVISSFKTGVNKILSGKISQGIQEFDARIKSGYGCLKVLEEIINNANVVDAKGPRHLIFHNPALGNSYLVKPQSLKLSTNQETNMIWNYALSMKGVASLEDVMSAVDIRKSRKKLILTGYMQSKADIAVQSITKLLSKI